MADLSSWLPGLLGPVELQEDGETVIAPAQKWNFSGITLSYNATTKTLTLTATPAAAAIAYEEFAPAPGGAPPSPPSHTSAVGNSTIAVDTSDADVTAVDIELDSAEEDGVHKWIVDYAGLAATKPITITPQSGQIRQWDGSMGSSLVLDENGDSVHLIKMFGDWVIA